MFINQAVKILQAAAWTLLEQIAWTQVVEHASVDWASNDAAWTALKALSIIFGLIPPFK